MTIDDLKDGQRAIITNLDVDNQLMERLFSFGITKSKELKKVKTSLGGATIIVELDRSCVILRADEAKSIEVEAIDG